MRAASERKGDSAVQNKEPGETVTYRRIESSLDQPPRGTESSNMMLDEGFDFELREGDMESVQYQF